MTKISRFNVITIKESDTDSSIKGRVDETFPQWVNRSDQTIQSSRFPLNTLM